LTRAVEAAKEARTQPSLVIVKTTLAYGAPDLAGSWHAHGNPLGVEEVKKTKRNLGWPEDKTFYIPDEALKHFRSSLERGKTLQDGWNRRFAAYEKQYPELAAEVRRRCAGELPKDWDKRLPQF